MNKIETYGGSPEATNTALISRCFLDKYALITIEFPLFKTAVSRYEFLPLKSAIFRDLKAAVFADFNTLQGSSFLPSIGHSRLCFIAPFSTIKEAPRNWFAHTKNEKNSHHIGSQFFVRVKQAAVSSPRQSTTVFRRRAV